ncbi:MAG: hypothetical protein K2M48_06610, partial [Clostridiales bacterium]|nr:hypothetical protein [Clostridiales bacterium]
MRVNAFCTARIHGALKYCDKAVYCGNEAVKDSRVEIFRECDEAAGGGIYIPSLTDEDAFAAACDKIIATDARAYVVAALDLEESGVIEAKYKLSPIMLLHKLGVLDKCA